MQRRTMTDTCTVNHSRSTALEQSVKLLLGRWRSVGVGWGRGLNRFYVATTLALSSAVV